MALELKPGSQWFYCRLTVGGKRNLFRLNVRIEGVRPPSLTGTSPDKKFERSRSRALEEQEALSRAFKDRQAAAQLANRLHAVRGDTGAPDMPLENLAERWKGESHHDIQARRIVDKFRAYAAQHNVTTVRGVTPTLAADWADALPKAGSGPRSVAVAISVMRTAFKRVMVRVDLNRNPFGGVEIPRVKTRHRVPFTHEEIEAIQRVKLPLEQNDELQGLITIGLTTAMRLADCAQLRWSSIKDNFIEVSTEKTEASVLIPIFPQLAHYLKGRDQKSEFVLPRIARQWIANERPVKKWLERLFKTAGTTKRFHSLRGTWITAALSAGVPEELVRRVTGHAAVDIVRRHYFHPDKEAFRSALENAMPAALSGVVEPERIQLRTLADTAPIARVRKILKLLEGGNL